MLTLHIRCRLLVVQVSEATLLPYLGGDLGAKAAAVEELIKYLPPVESHLSGSSAIAATIADPTVCVQLTTCLLSEQAVSCMLNLRVLLRKPTSLVPAHSKWWS